MRGGGRRAGPGSQHASLFSDSWSFPESAWTPCHHPPTEQELWGQSRGDRKLSRTRGGGGIVIDSSYNSSRNGVGALHLIL